MHLDPPVTISQSQFSRPTGKLSDYYCLLFNLKLNCYRTLVAAVAGPQPGGDLRPGGKFSLSDIVAENGWAPSLLRVGYVLAPF